MLGMRMKTDSRWKDGEIIYFSKMHVQAVRVELLDSSLPLGAVEMFLMMRSTIAV